LKTLEEPPPHVKFILATTDPQKVPVTVLSRCLQFNLKRLTREQIVGQLKRILEEEKIGFDDEGLSLLARGADGSMRDGLSLLDQAIAYGGGAVKGDEVRGMLGSIGEHPILALLQALAGGDGAALLQKINEMAGLAPDFTAALQELLALLHQLALTQMISGYRPDDAYPEERLRELAQQIPAEDVQLFYQIGLAGQKELPLAPDPRSGFEMVLLRMLAFKPVEADSPVTPAASGVAKNRPMRDRQQGNRVSASPPVEKSGPSGGLDPSDWHGFSAELKLGGIASQLANNCVFENWDGKVLTLKLDPANQQLRVGQSEKRLQEGIRQLLGGQVSLNIVAADSSQETPAKRQAREQQEKRKQAQDDFVNDPFVREMEEHFGAKPVIDSIKPVR
jgi:DNA polymerase-3 subunit gamma/tau